MSVRRGDGRVVTGQPAWIRSVKIGPFEAEQVSCVIIPDDGPVVIPGVGSFGPLLVSVERRGDSESLVLTRVVATPIVPRPLPPGTPPPKAQRPRDDGLPLVQRPLPP
ncbi:MAG: hypothetical protein U0835_04745 [Isosphaeraceae bacterium]